MFLGWVFNTLYLAFISDYCSDHPARRYKVLFIVIQVLLAGMLVSFPLQGYGVASIVLSTLHVVAVVIFCAWLFSDLKHLKQLHSTRYVRMSLIFFLISALGPFSLGPLIANGLGQSHWYYFAIYFYLHFQYNGVFIFGILALFYRLLEQKNIPFDITLANRAGTALFIACFPAYFLSTLWDQPGMIFNMLGLTGALLQVIFLLYFIKLTGSMSLRQFSSQAALLMRIALLAFVLKIVLQLLSAHPAVAQLAYNTRPWIIAYLHLVLVGVVSVFLLAWYLEKKIIQLKNSLAIILFITGFIGSEVTMLLDGIPAIRTISAITPALLLFLFSLLIVSGIGILYRACLTE